MNEIRCLKTALRLEKEVFELGAVLGRNFGAGPLVAAKNTTNAALICYAHLKI